MAQTYTTNAGTGPAVGVGTDYPMQLAPGQAGDLFDISDTVTISGNNETAARIAYGSPLVRNGSGLLPNSVSVAAGAATLLGISYRTDRDSLNHRENADPYLGGPAIGDAVNVLKVGAIYLPVWEDVAVADALRYFATGANAGQWGTTASAGNSLALTAGSWEIERPASAGGLIVLRINTPQAIAVTADA